MFHKDMVQSTLISYNYEEGFRLGVAARLAAHQVFKPNGSCLLRLSSGSWAYTIGAVGI